MPDGLVDEGHLTKQSLFLPSNSLELSRWQNSEFLCSRIDIFLYYKNTPPFFVVITGYNIHRVSFAGKILFRATSKFPLLNNYYVE